MNMVKKILRNLTAAGFLTLAACFPVFKQTHEYTEPKGFVRSAVTQTQGSLKIYVKPDSNKFVYFIMDTHALLPDHIYKEENAPIQYCIASLMEYLAEEKGVRMIGIEGYEGELKGKEYFRELKEAAKEVMEEMPPDKEMKDALKWIIAPYALEILEPDKFYTFGVDDKKLQEEYESYFKRMKEIANETVKFDSNEKINALYKEVLELDRKMNENKRKRGINAVRIFLEEMDRKGYKKGILVFGRGHRKEIEEELEKNCSYELFDPVLFCLERKKDSEE
ncbi:hypothetical protein DRH29_02600 [candidate division Kazan bacterium]|uniref:Uncharacterized protein n=1 Tax=candidate division Kazan bacterium TaxID=2202143 RepID=A0A420ZCW6_UNCK3|nr:MAG: hypothetical protein DRH29_02600 [candidate division Kazan bacterium]